MTEPRRVRRVLQGRPHPPAAADVLPSPATSPPPAAAVRDAFVVTWHHWRKVSRARGPRGLGPPDAWRHAQRRHTAQLWHREKGLDPEVKATLDALGEAHRRASARSLLLDRARPAPRSPRWPARSGCPAPTPSASCRPPTRPVPPAREVPTTEHPQPSSSRSRDATSPSSRWPRPTIIRRAGAARRRTHTVIGVGRGRRRPGRSPAPWSPTPTGVRPTLDRERVEALAAPTLADGARARGRAARGAMLTATQTSTRLCPAAGWTDGDTDDNTGGDGLAVALPGEPLRRPAPAPTRLVRTFAAHTARRARPPRHADGRGLGDAERPPAQPTTPCSAGSRLRRRPGPADLRPVRVDGVGDEAMLFELRALGRAPVRRSSPASRAPGRLHDHGDRQHRDASQRDRGSKTVPRLLGHGRRQPVRPARRRRAARPTPTATTVVADRRRPGARRCSPRSTCRRSARRRAVGGHRAAAAPRPTPPRPAATTPTSAEPRGATPTPDPHLPDPGRRSWPPSSGSPRRSARCRRSRRQAFVDASHAASSPRAGQADGHRGHPAARPSPASDARPHGVAGDHRGHRATRLVELPDGRSCATAPPSPRSASCRHGDVDDGTGRRSLRSPSARSSGSTRCRRPSRPESEQFPSRDATVTGLPCI